MDDGVAVSLMLVDVSVSDVVSVSLVVYVVKLDDVSCFWKEKKGEEELKERDRIGSDQIRSERR